MVAPIAPFRGGIARHSTALAAAFAGEEQARFRVQTFKRLYPRFLYPGKSDRDVSLTTVASYPVRRSLDSLNPFTWAIGAESPDIAVIPAWTFFVAPMLGIVARRLRRSGTAIIMIVHNLSDHEGARWKLALSRWQLAAADGFVVHTEDQLRQLREQGFVQPARVIPHPAYSDFPEPRNSLPRERALELLFFGLVRHYKGVDIALRALAASGLKDVRLTIAGEVWDHKDSLRQLLDRPELRGKVELIDRYVSDEEAAELFARCDAVMAPYRAVTGSGVLALARHYGRPVLASDLPGFDGLVEHGRNGWIFPAQDEHALSSLLRTSVTRENCGAMAAYVDQSATGTGWAEYGQSLISLGEQILDSRMRDT